MAGVGSASWRTSLLSSLSSNRDTGPLGELVALLAVEDVESDLVDALPGARETTLPHLPAPALEDVLALPDVLRFSVHSATGAPPGDSGSTASGSPSCSAWSARVVDVVAMCDLCGGVVFILGPALSSPACSHAFSVYAMDNQSLFFIAEVFLQQGTARSVFRPNLQTTALADRSAMVPGQK